eukprot:7026300-Pyramimonas_sp.AAC.1
MGPRRECGVCRSRRGGAMRAQPLGPSAEFPMGPRQGRFPSSADLACECLRPSEQPEPQFLSFSSFGGWVPGWNRG